MGTPVGATHDGQLLDIDCDEPCFNKQMILESSKVRAAIIEIQRLAALLFSGIFEWLREA
jgi:hypothetical protein